MHKRLCFGPSETAPLVVYLGKGRQRLLTPSVRGYYPRLVSQCCKIGLRSEFSLICWRMLPNSLTNCCLFTCSSLGNVFDETLSGLDLEFNRSLLRSERPSGEVRRDERPIVSRLLFKLLSTGNGSRFTLLFFSFLCDYRMCFRYEVLFSMTAARKGERGHCGRLKQLFRPTVALIKT